MDLHCATLFLCVQVSIHEGRIDDCAWASTRRLLTDGWMLTGMPMKDFFDCTTSPSTIAAVVQDTPVCKTKRQRIERSRLLRIVDESCRVGRVGRSRAKKNLREHAKGPASGQVFQAGLCRKGPEGK